MLRKAIVSVPHAQSQYRNLVTGTGINTRTGARQFQPAIALSPTLNRVCQMKGIRLFCGVRAPSSVRTEALSRWMSNSSSPRVQTMSSINRYGGFAISRVVSLKAPLQQLNLNCFGNQIRFRTSISNGSGLVRKQPTGRKRTKKKKLNQEGAMHVKKISKVKRRTSKIKGKKALLRKRIVRNTARGRFLASQASSSRDGVDSSNGSWMPKSLPKLPVPKIPHISLPQMPTILNQGDLFTVIGTVCLLLTIIVSPLAARYVQKSESNDIEFLDWDDPVAHTEKLYRNHLLEEMKDAILEIAYRGRQEQQDEEQGTDDLAGNRNKKRRDRPRILSSVEDMIAEVLESKVIEDAVTDFIARVFANQRIQEAIQKIVQILWYDLVNDPETTAQVVQLLNNAIENEEIQKAVRKLVLQLINDKKVYSELQQVVIRLGNEKEILSATQALLTESAHKALNDPEILDHSMAFATDVVGDDVVQRTSGEALRNTVTYAVRPGVSVFLTFAGVGLLFFSLSALRNARWSEEEGEMVHRALSSMTRNLQTNFSSGFFTILSLPGIFVSRCVSVAVAIVTAPFRLVRRAGSEIGRAGNAASDATTGLFVSIATLPGKLLKGAMSALGNACRSISKGVTSGVGRAIGGFVHRSNETVISTTRIVSTRLSGLGKSLAFASKSVGGTLSRFASGFSAFFGLRSIGSSMMIMGTSAPQIVFYVRHQLGQLLVSATAEMKNSLSRTFRRDTPSNTL